MFSLDKNVLTKKIQLVTRGHFFYRLLVTFWTVTLPQITMLSEARLVFTTDAAAEDADLLEAAKKGQTADTFDSAAQRTSTVNIRNPVNVSTVELNPNSADGVEIERAVSVAGDEVIVPETKKKIEGHGDTPQKNRARSADDSASEGVQQLQLDPNPAKDVALDRVALSVSDNVLLALEHDAPSPPKELHAEPRPSNDRPQHTLKKNRK
jgi:hypothetical protein